MASAGKITSATQNDFRTVDPRVPSTLNPTTGLPYPPQGNPTQIGPSGNQVLQAGGEFDPTHNTYSMPLNGGFGAGFGAGFGGGALGGLQANIAAPSANLGGVGNPADAARVAAVGPIDTSAAQSAAFARAKDQVGQESTGALAGLRSALGGTGGAGFHRTAQNIAGRGLGQLGDVSRQQAIDSSALAERTATTNYQGGIAQRGQDVSQRGQDISAGQSNADRSAGLAKTGYEGAIQQRGQNIAQQQEAARLAFEQAKARQASQQSVLAGLMSSLGKGTRVY